MDGRLPADLVCWTDARVCNNPSDTAFATILATFSLALTRRPGDVLPLSAGLADSRFISLPHLRRAFTYATPLSGATGRRHLPGASRQPGGYRCRASLCHAPPLTPPPRLLSDAALPLTVLLATRRAFYQRRAGRTASAEGHAHYTSPAGSPPSLQASFSMPVGTR